MTRGVGDEETGRERTWDETVTRRAVRCSFIDNMVIKDFEPTARIGGRIARVALVIFLGAACSRTSSAPPACLQFSADLMPDLAGGLIRKDFRIANAWAVKSDKMIDSSGVKFPAYFLSADIVAPSGEAVPATWVTTQITKPGLIWSVSPQAQKYTSWAKAGDASTTGITMASAGAKESVACVLSGRPASPQTGVTPKATTP